MKKFISAREAAEFIAEGMTIMVGGFLCVGTPDSLVQALVDKGTNKLTLIANDSSSPNVGVGKLIDSAQVACLIASYVGLHPLTSQAARAGEIKLILTPQGTLAEQIRAGGSGLGGILTPTGVGTVVADGKQKIAVDGKTYLLELPLKADVVLIKAKQADAAGNLVYHCSARNFNPLMAMAGKTVIAEVEEIVPVGAIDPDQVMTPGIFVDYLVKGGNA